MIDPPAGEAQAGLNVLGFQVREFKQHLFGGQPTGQEIENVGHADPHPSDARAPTTLLGINGDSLHEICHAILPTSIMPEPRQPMSTTKQSGRDGPWIHGRSLPEAAQPPAQLLPGDDLTPVGLSDGGQEDVVFLQ